MAYEWLARDLRIKAAMIRMGEKIAPFSECDLMEKAADAIEADHEVSRIMAMSDEQVITEGRIVAFMKARATRHDESMRAAITVDLARWYEGARDELDKVAEMIERGGIKA